MRRMIVPSEKPASTSSMIEAFVRLGVFSSFVGAFASVGGRRIRTVALPVVIVSLEIEPFPPRLRVSPLMPPLEPKISALAPSPGVWLFAASLLLLSAPGLKKGSSLHESSARSMPSWRESIARITFSVTPLRFNSIIRSGDRSKRECRLLIMEIMVFSLKPAFTSFTTEVFVSVLELAAV